MKAVLVIDLPKDCWDCHLVDEWGNCNAIKITSNKFGMNVNPYNNEKPSWCPLKPLSHKKEVDEESNDSMWWCSEHDMAYNLGYNACLKDITGEEK